MTFALQHTHCSECGTPFPQTYMYPRECSACGKIKWSNPIPVAVLLQPVWEKRKGLFKRRRRGLAAAVRANDPKAGYLALIGGFVDSRDTSIESAAYREFKEETSLNPASFPKLAYSDTNRRGNVMMFCTVDKAMHIEEWETGTPCEENERLDVIWEDQWKERRSEIAFPLHVQAITKWFRGEIK